MKRGLSVREEFSSYTIHHVKTTLLRGFWPIGFEDKRLERDYLNLHWRYSRVFLNNFLIISICISLIVISCVVIFWYSDIFAKDGINFVKCVIAFHCALGLGNFLLRRTRSTRLQQLVIFFCGVSCLSIINFASLTFSSQALVAAILYISTIVILIIPILSRPWPSCCIAIYVSVFAISIASIQVFQLNVSYRDYIFSHFIPTLVAIGICIYLETSYRSVFLRDLIMEMQSNSLNKSKKELESLVNSDHLTGLANRRYFEETFVREWDRAQRSKSSLSLLMLDIDHFKLFNDHYGHLLGDAVLTQIATILKRYAARESDLVARYGGEEFVIILPYTDTVSAHKIASDICRAVKNLRIKHALSPLSRYVTISLGVATLKVGEGVLPAESKEDLLKRADEALYAAKQHGKNRACIA